MEGILTRKDQIRTANERIDQDKEFQENGEEAYRKEPILPSFPLIPSVRFQ